MIEARAVRVAYGDREILHGVDLAIGEGELLAIVGPNGAGKTSLLRALSGVLRPTSGEVLLDGKRLHELPRVEVARALSVVPQHVPSAPGFSVRDVVAMGRAPHQDGWQRERTEDAAAIESALERCELRTLADREFDRLSGGERKRVLVAQALAQTPRVLLLDEPSAFLDLKQGVALFEIAREEVARGVAVVAIVHDLSLAARYADRVALLSEGRVAGLGAPEQVLVEPTLAATFGISIVRLSDAAGSTMAFAPAPRAR